MKTIKELIFNKKVVFFGDSITHNWEKYDHDYNLTHPEDENYPYGLGYGYVKMLNDVCNFKKVDNFAVSGGCYANCSDINPARKEFRHFPSQVLKATREIKEADYIFVMFGTNDYSEQVPFGDFNDFPTDEKQTDMSFYQGMNFGYSKIKELNPNATIFVINCLNRTCDIEANRTFNFSINEYNLAITHIARLYNLKLIDVSSLYNLKKNFVGGDGEIYSDDGLHPNKKGYEALTEFILNYEI